MGRKGIKRFRVIAGLALLLATAAVTAGSSATLTWTWVDPTIAPDKFKVLAYGNGILVAAGEDGVIYMSNDGITWTPESSGLGAGGVYVGAVYGGGKFVLAGLAPAFSNIEETPTNGIAYLATSNDGVNWTTATYSPGNASDDSNLVLAYCGGKFYAESDTKAAISSDGVHWTVHNNGGPTYSNDPLFCANGVLFWSFQYSSDGVNWNVPVSFVGMNGFRYVGSNGKQFFRWGNDPSRLVWTSTDGNHWTEHALPGSSPNFGYYDFRSLDTAVIWNGTQFVALYNLDSNIKAIYTSPDGINWTWKGRYTGLGGGSFEPEQMVFTGSEYFSVGFVPLEITQSSNAVSWSIAFNNTGTSIGSGAADLIIHAGGQYIAVSGTDSISSPAPFGILQSPDGITWNSVYASTVVGASNNSATVAYGNGLYVATNGGQWVSSTNGINWSVIANPPGGLVSDLVYGNGVFAGFLGTCDDQGKCSSSTSVTSADGVKWASHPLPAEQISGGAFTDIGYTGSQFVALGRSNDNSLATVFTSPDGINWTAGSQFTAAANTTFTRIRAVGSGLAAVGAALEPCTLAPQDCGPPVPFPIVARSEDGITWFANAIDDGDFAFDAFNDITFNGTQYFATDGGLAVSSDAIHWCHAADVPLHLSTDTVVTQGNTMLFGSPLVLATFAFSGAKVTCLDTLSGPTPPSTGGGGGGGGGGGTGTGGSSGKSGGFDLLSLTALLGLAALRRRGRGRG